MKFLKLTIIFILFNTVCFADINMKIGSKGKLSEVDRVIEVKMYDNLQSDIDFLSKFSNRNQNNVDLAGFIRKNSENEVYISFGKYKNKTLEEIYNLNAGYFSWILRSEFPLFTKDIITDFLNEKKLKKKFES